MQDRKRLEEAVANDARIASMTDDLDTLFELAREGEDVTADIAREHEALRRALLEKLETAMLLSGENDAPQRHRDHPSRAPAAPKARTGPRCSCACTCAGPSATASRP